MNGNLASGKNSLFKIKASCPSASSWYYENEYKNYISNILFKRVYLLTLRHWDILSEFLST